MLMNIKEYTVVKNMSFLMFSLVTRKEGKSLLPKRNVYFFLSCCIMSANLRFFQILINWINDFLKQKKELSKTALYHIVFEYYYCNLKMIGTVKEQRTALPRCLPGFQFGML